MEQFRRKDRKSREHHGKTQDQEKRIPGRKIRQVGRLNSDPDNTADLNSEFF
jgi:hypothetical protein